MSKLKEFLAYLQEQVRNKSVYVRGAQGQLFHEQTGAWVEKREKGYEGGKWIPHVLELLKEYKEKAKADESGAFAKALAFDCSGLIMYWVQNIMKLSAKDKSANTLWKECKKIAWSEREAGCFVFRVVDGKAIDAIFYSDVVETYRVPVDSTTVCRCTGMSDMHGCCLSSRVCF